MAETVHDVLVGVAIKLEFLEAALNAFATSTDEVSHGAFFGASDLTGEALQEVRRITGPELCGGICIPEHAEQAEEV